MHAVYSISARKYEEPPTTIPSIPSFRPPYISASTPYSYFTTPMLPYPSSPDLSTQNSHWSPYPTEPSFQPWSPFDLTTRAIPPSLEICNDEFGSYEPIEMTDEYRLSCDSCTNRCSEEPFVYSQQRCFCDSLCMLYKDCCYDLKMECPGNFKDAEKQMEIIGPIEPMCIELKKYVGLCLDSDIMDKYYSFINKCNNTVFESMIIQS